MRFIFSLFAAAFLAINLTGCIVVGGDHDGWDNNDDWRSQQIDNREIISQLDLNASRSFVLDRLGAPSFSDAFTADNDEFRILYYRTQHRHSDGETSKDETTPLVFKNDRLIGWGQEILAKVQH